MLKACNELKHELSRYRVVLDADDTRPGAKFYKWEKQGVPVRIEVGPRDISKRAVTLVRRDTGKKEVVERSKLQARVAEVMTEVPITPSLKEHKRFCVHT